LPGKKGPDNTQLQEIVEHGDKVLKTLAPRLVLYLDVIQGEGYRQYNDYDSLPVEYDKTVRETRYHFSVTGNPKPNVEKEFGEIVKETGYSKPTVSKILDRLISDGVVIKVGKGSYAVNPFRFGL